MLLLHVVTGWPDCRNDTSSECRPVSARARRCRQGSGSVEQPSMHRPANCAPSPISQNCHCRFGQRSSHKSSLRQLLYMLLTVLVRFFTLFALRMRIRVLRDILAKFGELGPKLPPPARPPIHNPPAATA